MTRRMADSITPTDIPVNDPTTGRPWDLVLGYVDGRYAWSAAGWARFPNSVHVRCAVSWLTLDADVLDCEPGDATAAQAVQWTRAKRARGDAEPTVYVGRAAWGALQAAFVTAGVPHPHYAVAAYPGSGPVQETLNGITSVFHQYADPQYGPGGQGSGGHYDLSAVVDGWPTFTPLAVTEDEMCTCLTPIRTMGNWLVWVGESEVRDTQIQLTSGTWQGLPIGQIDDATLARRRALQAAREEQLLNPPSLGTLTVSVPTEWEVTDLGGGVVQIKAKTG